MASELIAVAVKPRSTRAGVVLAPDGSIVVRVHAPAAEGAANKELLETFAQAVGVPKSAVRLVRGDKSRSKQLTVERLSREEVLARVAAFVAEKSAEK
jgi:uncharacterized protein